MNTEQVPKWNYHSSKKRNSSMRVKPHKYTEEELQFFREYAVGHYRREIQEEFIKRFGWNITLIQIKNMLKKLKKKLI